MKIHAVFLIVLSIQSLYKSLSVTQFPVVSSEEFHFKMLSWPVRDVANYARCITAFSRLRLMSAMYNLGMYMKVV